MAYAGEEEKADYIQIINSNNELLLKLIMIYLIYPSWKPVR